MCRPLRFIVILPAVILLVPIASGAADASKGNLSRGRRAFFSTCTSCHASTDSNRATGPSLHGLPGRTAGTREGYKYSDAMKNSALVWTEELLDQYLAKPDVIFPGTPMTTGVSHASMRADLIVYLKTLGAK